jgi:hypothetical protein
MQTGLKGDKLERLSVCPVFLELACRYQFLLACHLQNLARPNGRSLALTVRFSISLLTNSRAILIKIQHPSETLAFSVAQESDYSCPVHQKPGAKDCMWTL